MTKPDVNSPEYLLAQAGITRRLGTLAMQPEGSPLTAADLAELHYLLGRLVGLRTRLGQDINEAVYYDGYRVRIEALK